MYVLEFCRRFLGPTPGIEKARTSEDHGGFERYSGRLLRWDPKDEGLVPLAERLDLPTHVLLTAGGRIFVSFSSFCAWSRQRSQGAHNVRFQEVINRIGLPLCCASARAPSPQGHQCTGLSLCCSK